MGLLNGLSTMGIRWNDLQNENMRPFYKAIKTFKIAAAEHWTNGGPSWGKGPVWLQKWQLRSLASPWTQLIGGGSGMGLGISNYSSSALSLMIVIKLYQVTWESMKPMAIVKKIIPNEAKIHISFQFYFLKIANLAQ